MSRVADEAVQIHGGYGDNMREYEVSGPSGRPPGESGAARMKVMKEILGRQLGL